MAADAERARGRGALVVVGTVVATAATITAVTAVTRTPSGGGGQRHDDGGGGAPLVTVYFVGKTAVGPRLYAERRQFGGRTDVLPWSLSNVVEGNALDDDYLSRWPRGASVRSARLHDGVVRVDLDGPVVRRPPSLSGDDAALAVEQLVRSAQSVARTRAPVLLRHEGRPAATVLGVPASRALQPAADTDVLAPVSIATPGEDTAMTSPFVVRGLASTRNGRITWQLRQGSMVVKRGTARTSRCCALAPYRFSVQVLLGSYTLVVQGGGDKGPRSSDTKQIRVDNPTE